MAEEPSRRRLAAILAADVVGYSRLMEADEAATLAALKARRQEVLDPLVARHRGRIFKVVGDGVLVEFASAVNAVQCAIELQEGMARANDGQPEDRQIVLRIGVNLGDVMVEGGDLYGDGVNIAARLEALAAPGGILVSATAHDHVGNKVKVGFEDIGAQSLKNIARPVRAYRVASAPTAAAAAPRPVSDKPSLAVLPFNNISGDPEQEYFSDGITEDIITELSRFRSLLVMARNSSFQYKGKSVDVRQVARELGVQYVVEGSVRKLGDRVRITGQLIDARSGNHLWSERYDRALTDIFAVQDEVVRSISSGVPGHLERHVADRARRKAPASLSAFDYLLRGRWSLWNGPDVSAALANLHKAIETDREYGLAHAHIAHAHAYSRFFLGVAPELSDKLAVEHAVRSVQIDGYDPEILYAVSIAFVMSAKWELADMHSARAVHLNPIDATALQVRGLVLAYLGRHDEAMQHFADSATLSPYAADDWRNEHLCDCLYMRREFDRFFAICNRWMTAPPHMSLEVAAAHALLGHAEEARLAMTAFESKGQPKPDAAVFARVHARMCQRAEDGKLWLDGYRMAGVPV